MAAASRFHSHDDDPTEMTNDQIPMTNECSYKLTA
jgi:hypothetical protein